MNTGRSYAEILREARARISLTDIGIDAPKIRKTASGRVLIKVAGPGRNDKANVLANRLKEVLKEEVSVTRPSIKGSCASLGWMIRQLRRKSLAR